MAPPACGPVGTSARAATKSTRPTAAPAVVRRVPGRLARTACGARVIAIYFTCGTRSPIGHSAAAPQRSKRTRFGALAAFRAHARARRLQQPDERARAASGCNFFGGFAAPRQHGVHLKKKSPPSTFSYLWWGGGGRPSPGQRPSSPGRRTAFGPHPSMCSKILTQSR